jgi:hypothetical protein
MTTLTLKPVGNILGNSLKINFLKQANFSQIFDCADAMGPTAE